MKAINFRGYTQPDKESIYTLRRKYCFWLPGRWFYFGSERTCLAFMAECSEFFSQQLYEINDIYPQLFKEWRSLWMYELDNTTEKKIITEFNNLEIHLNKASAHGHSASDSSLSYFNMMRALDNMNQLCQLFKNIHDKRSSTTLKKDMLLLQKRIARIKKDTETYMGPDAAHLKPEQIKMTAEQTELMPPDLSVSLP